MKWLQQTDKIWHKLDLSSLGVRLTVGIAAVCVTGLGSVAIWTSWRMQQILIVAHKQNIESIAKQFPRDVEMYSEMLFWDAGLQKAIDNRTTGNTVLWVKYPSGTIAAQSTALRDNPNSSLLSLIQMPLQPQVYRVNGRYWVLCSTSLQVKGIRMGTLYLAQDITSDQIMFLSLIRTLGIGSILAILVITVAIAFYIKRSLHPLAQLSQIAGTISANDIHKAQLRLDSAPTEVKELARMWEMMLSRLSQAWEQERQFVSNVSHELRTPLTIVHGYLQSVLRRGNNLTQMQREALETASEEAERTIHLFQDLLDLARADSGHLHFHLETLILNDFVAEVVGMAEQFSDRAFKIEASTNIIPVKADRNRLKQVLLNLIDNSIKYSESYQPITLKLNHTSEQATLQVCDQGCGIPLPQQALIFERFYRIDEARSRSTGGAGLGLSIVKTLVEGMGGNVTVRSKLGEGSVFTVTLPLVNC
jgi:signal transduction histidine kinase